MFDNFIQKIGEVVVGIGLTVSSFLGITSEPQGIETKAPEEQILGAAPQFISANPSSLYGSGITSTQTSLTLTSFTFPGNASQLITTADITPAVFLTIEPTNPTKKEFVSCTTVSQNSNGTATLSGCNRGLSFASPYTASSTLRQSHSGGVRVVASNSPSFYDAIIAYVNTITAAGVVDASGIAKGIVEVATGAEAAATAAIGSGNTSAPLTLTTAIATSTFNTVSLAANKVVVTESSGKISNKFFEQGVVSTSTTANFATSSINIGAFPAYAIGKNIRVFSTTGTSTFAIPSGVTKIKVEVVGGGGGGEAGVQNDEGGGGGDAGGYSLEYVDVSATTSVQVFVGSGGAAGSGSGGNGAAGTWSTFGTNGFYLYATGGSGGDAALLSGQGGGGTGVGGDLNITGGPGSTTGDNGVEGSSGSGGTSFYGGGGRGFGYSTADQTGNAGGSYGGGGGGGSGGGNGGVGGQGVVIIEW